MKNLKFRITVLFVLAFCFSFSVRQHSFYAVAEEAYEESFFEESFFSTGETDDSLFFEEYFDNTFFQDTVPGDPVESAISPDSIEAELESRSVITIPPELIVPDEPEAWQGVPLSLSSTPTRNVNKITLSWGHPEGVKKLPSGVKYYVYETDPETGISRQIGKATTNTKITLSGLIEGDHSFFVRAEKNNPKTGVEIYGTPTDTITCTVTNSSLWKNKPELSLTQTESESVRIVFTVKEPADSYEIKSKIGKEWRIVEEIEGNGSLRYETILTESHIGEKLSFFIVPWKNGVKGKASATKSITVTAPWQAAPQLTAEQIGDRRVALSWSTAAPADEYRILIDGKAVADSAIEERNGNSAVVILKKNGKHKFQVQPWGTGTSGKRISGNKSSAVTLKLLETSKLGALNIKSEWRDEALVISWASENSGTESFDIFLWTAGGDTDHPQRFAHIPANETYRCEFSNLTPEVWYYCIRANINTAGTEKGRILSPISSYDVSKAPPVFYDREIWQLSDSYTATWKAVWPTDKFLLKLDGKTVAAPSECFYALHKLPVGQHMLQVCAADERENTLSFWSEPLLLHICAPVTASVLVENDDVAIGEDASFHVQAEGGKGDYDYLFTLILPDGTAVYTKDKEALYTYTLEQRGEYKLYTTVTDSLVPDGIQADPVSVQAVYRVEQDGITYTLDFTGEYVEACVTGFSGGSAASIAEQIEGAPVTRIDCAAFAGHEELNVLTIPENVTEFEAGWNEGCGEALLIRCQPGSAARNEAVFRGIDYDCGGRKRALILAQTYADNPLTTLKAPANDAEALKAAFESWGFEAEIVMDATANGMLNAIDEILGDAGEDDLSVVTYSGHGMTNGSMPGSDYASSTVGVMTADAFADALSSVSGRKTVIVDACYSGVLIEDDEENEGVKDNLPANTVKRTLSIPKGSSTPITFESSFTQSLLDAFSDTASPAKGASPMLRRSGALLGAERTWVMVSAAAGQEAWEANMAVNGQRRNMGFFSFYLTLGLGWNGVTRSAVQPHADGNTDEAVSFNEAFSYAYARTAEALKKYGKTQTALASPANAKEFAPFRR